MLAARSGDDSRLEAFGDAVFAVAVTPLEVFDARAFAGHHLVSVGVGLFALAWALAAPLQVVFVSPMCFALMGPAHYAYGRHAETRRRQLREQLAERAILDA
jgi:hypothetical protein